jgi:rod shape-determining protein MreC
LPQLGGQMINSVLSPVEKISHEAFGSVSYLWTRYVWLLNVEAERTDLSRRVRALEAETSRLAELESENERLRGLLGFTEASGLHGIAATVIGRDPSNWVRTVTIDRGSDHGIRPGFAVVDGRAVIGQTIVVGARSSRVLLLTDNSSAIAALVQGNRAQGIAEGSLGKSLTLRYVLKDYPVAVGERVIASGLDGVYPKGVLLGVVSQVQPDSAGLFQTVLVEPSVDLNRIEDVLVIKPDETKREGPPPPGDS